MAVTVEDFKKQHLNNYKRAVAEFVKNNTNALVKEDILSLLKKPPLDSMDVIKNKFLELAKKEKVVLDVVQLDIVLGDYRNELKKVCKTIIDIREKELMKIVDSFQPKKDTDIIKYKKADFTSANKEIRKLMKSHIEDSIAEKIVKNVNKVFTNNISDEQKKYIVDEIVKFLNKSYIKQVLDGVDFKILVKDTILINGIKEQGERYLFTNANSRLLNDL